jgi:acetyl-CoA decarbonylase/synthase complex subunit beta
MFEEIPVEVGLVHEGERIRRKDMQLELGGPDVKEKFELVLVRPSEEVQDGAIHIEGPDLEDLAEGGSYTLGILIEVSGKQLEENLEGVVERRIHEYSNYVQGLMHLNQRYDIWVRLSKKSFKKGFTSLQLLGKVLIELFKNELPIIERMQVTFITDKDAISSPYARALSTYEARDARARGLTDEEVDAFYGCALCQSFAPTHVCVITPQRYANCGAISWFDGKAAASIDPEGPIFTIAKGACLDPVKGEYEGVNENARKKSLGEVERVWLYSAFGYPHTSCGCFEGIAFFIPEVEGFGIVHRGFQGLTVNGLPFSTMADTTAGGRQVDGFHGISLEYMRSPKFLIADGGYDTVVWMPSDIKDKLKSYIPPKLYSRIATEQDSSDLDGLKQFLLSHEHPVVARWKEEAPEATTVPLPGLSGRDIPLVTNGVRIVLKNARIYADRAIIEPLNKERKG